MWSISSFDLVTLVHTHCNIQRLQKTTIMAAVQCLTLSTLLARSSNLDVSLVLIQFQICPCFHLRTIKCFSTYIVYTIPKEFSQMGTSLSKEDIEFLKPRVSRNEPWTCCICENNITMLRAGYHNQCYHKDLCFNKHQFIFQFLTAEANRETSYYYTINSEMVYSHAWLISRNTR